MLGALAKSNRSKLIDGVPPTLQYEQVFLSHNPAISASSDDGIEKCFKDKIIHKLKELPANKYYNRLANLDVDAYLTTNYDHAFYGKQKKKLKRDYLESVYSVRRWKQVEIAGKQKVIYHIHGDLTNVKSIMLGIDHYGGALAKIQDFVKGNYNRDKFENVPRLINRLKSWETIDLDDIGFKDAGTRLISWIDAFFFCDLHIIGFSLDFSEIDIWWLLTRWAR